MNNSLERIQIVGLHGNKTVDIKVRDNILILVGENGSGKTTILRILFYFLSGNWLPLFQFRFDEIVAVIDGNEHKVTKKELEKNFEEFANRHILRDLPQPLRYRIRQLIKTGHSDRILIELQEMSEHYRIPLESLMQGIKAVDDIPESPNKKTNENIEKIRKAIPAQILYLPTYRRIERELSSIFEDVNPDDFHRKKDRFRRPETYEGFIELVEFGMKDVQKAIDRELGKLKEFARENLNSLTLGYLGDVVDRNYQNVGMKEIADLSEDTIRSVLDRIDETILTKTHKEHLFEEINLARSSNSTAEHSKIISHYFLKLLEFQKLLQAIEKPIRDFCALCSEYTVDKQLVYDSANFSFSIVTKDISRPLKLIELSDLSSGEKQIVSLFSHLYLSGLEKYFVLIDEPELSLSVPWQRRFLIDIYKSGFCAGLIAATHSPFIYDNDLHQYAHSLGEFVNI
jgi:predicted ATP-binding protein involved in virulence